MDDTAFETLTHIGDGLASSTDATGDTRTRASNNSETLSMQLRTDRTPLPVTPEAGEPTASIAKKAALLSPANPRVRIPLKQLVADLPSCAERCEVVLPDVDSMHLNSRGGVLPLREAMYVPQRELHRNPIKEGQRCVVHPQGFRILKDTSVMERSMRGYFRLPPAPNRRLREERNHLHRKLLRIERGELAELNNATGGVGMVLDGFLLLSAAAVENPDEVEAVTLQDSHLTGAVVEDLSYFTNLFFLDVSENAVNMEELLPLTGLETLHMACNDIRSLRGLEKAIQWQVAQSSDQFRPFTGDSNANMGSTRSSALHDVLLPNLIALNLSYNVIPSHHLTLLSHFPCLEKLDLSGNYLKELPADLSLLTSVTHLALEGNLFVSKNRRSNGVDVFDSLATMPSLIEVNLNHNKLSRVPVMSVQDGRGLCFPSIEVIGLSDNRFRTTEDVLPLACLHRTLRRVVLSNNPICSNPRNFKTCRLQFEQIIIEAYYDRTTKDMMSPRSCAEAEESQRHSLKLQEDGDMWKEETWSRLIPQDFEALCNTGHHILDVSAAAAAAAAAVAAEGSVRDLTHGAYDAPHFDSCAERSALPTEKGEFFGSHERQDGSNSGFLKTGHSSIKDYFATAEAYLSANNVDIVFQDADMPKRPLRYFYGTQTRAGGQSNLVTVPPYGEFMDIYGIVGRRKARAPFECKRRRAERKRRVYVPPVLSSSSESVDAETVGAEEEATMEPVVPSTGGDSGTFFITETEVCGKVAKGRPRPTEDDPVPESQPCRSPSSNPTRRSKGRKAAAFSLLKPPVVSPVSVNVHGAINELKALLRKPLPPLPYGKTYSMSKS